MESQPQNPEFRSNPENFHPCYCMSYADQLIFAPNVGFTTVYVEMLFVCLFG